MPIHTVLGPAGQSASQITWVGLPISGTGSSANSDSSCSFVSIWFQKTFGNASRYYLILKREEAGEQSHFCCLPWLSQGQARARGPAGLYVRKLAGARSPHRAFSPVPPVFWPEFSLSQTGKCSPQSSSVLLAVVFSVWGMVVRGGGLGFSSASAEGRALPAGLGHHGLQLPRLSPQCMLPWVHWDRRKKWPHTGASQCLRGCRQSHRGSGWHMDQEKEWHAPLSYPGLQSPRSASTLMASSLGRSLAWAFLFPYLRFRLIVEQRVEGQGEASGSGLGAWSGAGVGVAQNAEVSK